MMFFKSFLFAAFALLAVTAQQSNGKQQAINECVGEFDSQLSNEEYRMRHANAFRALDEVNKAAEAAKQKVSTENEKKAIQISQEGYNDSIKCVAVAGYLGYTTNNEVRKLSDVEAGKQKLNEANASSKKTIGAAGLVVYRANGIATQLVGKQSKQQLKESIKFITFAGQYAYSGLDVANALGVSVLDKGAAAKEQGLNASSAAIENAGANCYDNLVESALIAFEAIGNPNPATEDTSYGDAAARENSEASSTIESVKNAAESTKKQISKGAAKEAVSVVRDGIIAAIKSLAGVTKKTQEALESAQNGGKSSIKSVREAIKKAENDIAYAAANAYQSLGRAIQIVGNENVEKLLNAMAKVEAGRAGAYNSTQSGKYSAVAGLENDETSERTGIKAAIDAVRTGGYIAYNEFQNAAKIAFDILKE